MLKKLSTLGVAIGLSALVTTPAMALPVMDAIECGASYYLDENGICQELPTRNENLPPYVANVPTEVTITKIDPANNKVWIEFTAMSGVTSGLTDKYRDLNVLRVSTNEYEGMTDEMLMGSWFGIPTWGQRIVKQDIAYNDRETSFSNNVVYEFDALNDIKTNGADWYYWVVFDTLDHQKFYSVRGRVDFSDCMNSSAFVDGMTCQAQMGEDGIYHYHLYDGDVEVEIPELATPEEPEIGDVPGDGSENGDDSGETGSDSEDNGSEDGDDNRAEPEVVEKVVEKIVKKEVPVEKIVVKEVPVEKIVEKEVIREVPVEKVVIKEVPVEVIRYVESGSTAEETKNASEGLSEALAGISSEIAGLKEVEVPNLSGLEIKQEWNYWWIVALVLGFAAGFSVMAVLRQSRE